MGRTMQQRAMIYLAGKRGFTVRDGLQSHHTLNFGDYFNEHRKPFFDLLALNDETLNAETTTQYEMNDNVYLILIPVVGGIHFQIDDEASTFVEAGQSLSLGLKKGSVLTISNSYKEPVNYLQLRFRMEGFVAQHIEESFDIDQSRDSLSRILSSPAGYIGKFSGRCDATFLPKETSRGVFAFVIEGAFELQNRLVEARDSLSITNADEIEFEALSSGAILLIIDL